MPNEDVSLDRDTCLKLFSLEPGFTKKTLSNAYRKTVKLYHPDKVAALATEFKELAERRTKQINQAYDFLMKELQ